MAWFSFGSQDFGLELAKITERLDRQLSLQYEILRVVRNIREQLVAVNDDLNQVKTLLDEASSEIVSKIDELVAQVGDSADPALVADLKSRAQSLADIVPNETPEQPDPS